MKHLYTSKRNEVLVDDEDYELFKRFNWWIDNTGYPCTRIGEHRYPVRMHTIIMPSKSGLVTDHIDQNKLNNQRSNLRHLPSGLNLLNTKASGVKKTKYYGEYRYQSVVSVKGKQYNFGTYTDFDVAKDQTTRAKAILYAYFTEHGNLPAIITDIPDIAAIIKPRATKEQIRENAVRSGRASGKVWTDAKRHATMLNLQLANAANSSKRAASRLQ
jgi:hypothetical protein